MPTYKYEGAYSNGERVSGVIDAMSQNDAVAQIRQTCEIVLSLKEVPNLAIRNLIREGKTPQIVNAIQTTGSVGNILMDRCLQNLRAAGTISEETYRAALRDQSQPDKAPGMQAPARGGPPGFKRTL